MNNFSRATSALVLSASLLASSVAAVGQTTTTKATDEAEKTQSKAETKQPEGKQADEPTDASKAHRRKDGTAGATAPRHRQVNQAAFDQRKSRHDRKAKY